MGNSHAASESYNGDLPTLEIRLRYIVATFQVAIVLACASLFASLSWADEASSLPDAPKPSPSATHGYVNSSNSLGGKTQSQASLSSTVQRQDSREHHFWDSRNAALFSTVGASRALDYFSTLNMRRRGRQEILLTNNIVDNHPAFAAIEAGGTAVSVGAAYLFHRYHHHRLEHWTSTVHAGLASSGAVRNYCLKTAHASTP